MNLTKLEIVVLIGRHRKVTAVAELLGMKQPTVTFHMKSLEKELGVPLFQTFSGKTFLTDAGKALHHYAVKMLALYEESRRVLREYEGARKGALLIGASHVPAAYLLPRAIGAFRRDHPDVSISLVVRTAPEIDAMLQAHEIDLGVFSGSGADSDAVRYERLCGDELVLVCSPGHPLARETDWEAGVLERHELIMHDRSSSTRIMCEQWAAEHGVRLRACMELGSAESI